MQNLNNLRGTLPLLFAIALTDAQIMNFPEFPSDEEVDRNTLLCFQTACERGYLYDSSLNPPRWIGGDLPESFKLLNELRNEYAKPE